VGRLLARGVIGGLFIGHGTQKLKGWFGGGGLDATANMFEQLGLPSVPKTTGKRGLHILIPLAKGHTYDDAQSFALKVGETVVEGRRPEFVLGAVAPELATVLSVYRLRGIVRAEQREQALVEAAAASAVQSSAIEGEALNWDAVRSSVARRLGVDRAGVPQDDKTEGVVAMTLDATRNYEPPLTESRMFQWHSELFPRMLGQRERDIVIGSWRQPASDPMQVISGPLGRERPERFAKGVARL